MSDAATMVSSLRERYAELRDLYDATFREFNADGLITEDERVRLDAISTKLAEIERLLNQAQDAAATEAASGGSGGSGSGSGASGGTSSGSGGEAPEPTGDIFSDAFDAVTEAGGEALGAAGEMLGDAANAASELLSGITETFTGSAREIAQSAHDAAERAASGLAGAVGDAAEAARRSAETAAQEASARAEEAAGRAEEAMREANELTGEAAEAAMQRAQEAARLAREAAEEAAAMLGTLVGEAEQQLRGVGRQIVEGAEGAARQAGEAIDTAAEEARDAAEDAREAASGIEEEVRRLAGAASDLASEAAQRLATLIEEKKRMVEEAIAAAVEAARQAAERAEQVVRDITGIGFTEAEEEKLAELEAAGLDREEREALMRQARDDPGVLAQATAALSRMEELSVPAGDRGELIRLAQANQAGFDAAMEVIANMEGGGDMDVSDDAMADLSVKITEAESAWNEADERLQGLIESGAPQAEIDALAAEMEALSEAADQAQADFTNRSEKRTLLDALSYGPLSVDRPEPMEPQDVTALIQAYGRNSSVANSAIELAGRAEDPSVIAQNVSGVLDVTEGGFAPPGGDPLAEGYDGEFDAMAVNMLRNGAAMGQDYFDGAQDYYASGAQTQPDPCGGRSGDDVGEVNIRRTAMMGREMLDENGQVNVGTEDAQSAMDHMLYHPGSLSEQSYSPNVTGQMRGVYDLFSDPATSEDASNVINGISAPADGAPNAGGARSIVGRTMDVDPDSVSDEDTRAAVLSGMLTTFHQGNVGSCFATGAARRQRIEDPIQTMENMAEIATTGQFQSPLPGPPPMPPIPANQNIPDGENPIMRSLEYTVAAGSAMLSNSNEHGRMNDGLWDTGGNGRGLGELQGIVGNDTWNGTGEVDEDGDLDEGMETRLRRALAQQLRFDYNARELDTSGPGDGSSSHGAFEVIYQGNTIETEDAFQDAVETIAMSAAGSPDEATREAITELIQSDAFVDSIYAAYGTNRSEAPWNLSGGGSGQQAVEFLTGNRESYTGIIAQNDGADRGTQTRALLDGLVADMGSDTGLVSITTNGVQANHFFMGTPEHPTFQAISGPDSAQQIEDTLVTPGQEMATTALPEQQTSRLYEEQIQTMMTWNNAQNDEASMEALQVALRNGPTEGLSPQDLQAYIDTQLADFNTRQRELEREEADQWRADQEDPVSDADYQARLDALEERADGWVENELRSNLIPEFDLPHVVIADTNWGDHDSSTLFAIAPDPLTGELRMYARDPISGSMRPQGANWETAGWWTSE